ncbi:MAG: FkbM family methyltransferase [Kineosporiaceae bacterium]
MFRLLHVWLRRPDRVRTHTGSGLVIDFDYPSQMMPTLVLFGDLLEPEIRMLPHVLKKGMVAVDVGASIGTWALSAARAGARVLACEPDPQNVGTLRGNIAANKLDARVEVRRIGLGSGRGWAQLVPQKRRYLNRVTRLGPEPGTGTSGVPEPADRFPLTTLDAFSEDEELPRIDVVKVNTAGGELEVLDGCRGLLRQQRIDFLLLLDGDEIRAHLDEFTEFGYDIGIWDGDAARLRTVPLSSDLASLRRTPMNRYVILCRKAVTAHHAGVIGAGSIEAETGAETGVEVGDGTGSGAAVR